LINVIQPPVPLTSVRYPLNAIGIKYLNKFKKS
jgi:hypothetical protein